MNTRSLLYPAMLALVMLFVTQCKNAEQDGPATRPNGKQITIKATLEQPVGTKTSLSSERKVLWSAGDKIKVYNSSTPSGVVYTLSGGAGTTAGEFTGDALSGNGPFYAVYPAEAGGSLSGTGVAVTLPATQSYVEGGFGSGAAVAAAKAEAIKQLNFKNVLGGVAFTLSGSKSISGIRLQTLGDEALNGAGTVSLSGDTPSLSMGSKTSDDQSILSLDGPGAASASFCLMLPPGAFEQGFLVEFLDGEGNVMFKSAKATVNKVTRSSILDMPESAYTAQYKAAFFESDSFGYFPAIGADAALDDSKAYDSETCQYAFKTGSTRYIRVQSLSKGFYTEITTPKDMSLGTAYDVSVDILSNTSSGASMETVSKSFTVLKKTEDRVWLVNGSEGVIQKLED